MKTAQRTILVRVHAPKTVRVRIPAGLSPKRALEHATAKAAQYVLFSAATP